MNFNLKQQLKLQQQLIMTPQLQQAIKLLQFSYIELNQYIATQLVENPLLEESSTNLSTEDRESPSHKSLDKEQSLERQSAERNKDINSEIPSYFQENTASIYPSSRHKNDHQINQYEYYTASPSTLMEALLAQCSEVNFTIQEQKIATIIIGNLDEKGYFSTDLKTFCIQENFNFLETEGVLDTIQRFFPSGIASRNPQECLLHQLRAESKKYPIVKEILENHYEDLKKNKINIILNKINISLDDFKEQVKIISKFELIPARNYYSQQTQYISPDVYIFKVGKNWKLMLNEGSFPQLHISSHYREMKNLDGVKSYLDDKAKSAHWLIKSLEQRRKTIYQVSQSILEFQINFFEKGLDHLKPMILKDIADHIHMHESTVSRITTNKYIQTPHGLFELKYFFNSSIDKKNGGQIASKSVKTMISKFIKNEDPQKPYSDKNIVDFLYEKGIYLARRTVAKYRDQLHIPSSSKRKKTW